MLELIFGTYGVLCWLVFKKLKLVKVTTYSVCTAILIGVAGMLFLLMMLMMYHPMSKDGRLYVFTTPIVPQVKGVVTEVVKDGRQVKEGDVLFQIDPQPYRYEVERLTAALAEANAELGQLEARMRAAESSTKAARSGLLASESQFDRQARQELEQAQSEVTRIKAQKELEQKQLERYQELFKQDVVSQGELDRAKQQFDSSAAALTTAEGMAAQAAERIQAGGNTLQSSREELNRTKAQEEEVRVALETQSEGINPQVRQIMAELDKAHWDLEQTTVRAATDGYVTQVILRPGQMVTPLPMVPVMVFVQGDKPVLGASFPQNVIANFKPGLEAELAFKAYPGKIFKAKLNRVLPAIYEGQLVASGQLRGMSLAANASRIPVFFDYDLEDKEIEALNLPGGAQATIAVYTEKMHALSIVRKILLRIKSWENYLFIP